MQMPAPALTDHEQDAARIDCWLFDLDNTLYPATGHFFAQIDAKITAYVGRVTGVDRAAAYQTQKRYFHQHGTTLAGLMADHDVDPDDYLRDVHDIDLGALAPDPALIAAIAALPGRKLVFTNADADYGQQVLDRLGLGAAFEAIYDIRAANYVPKPHPQSYANLCARHAVNPARAIMVEDMARNLRPAKQLGMATLWVNNGSEQAESADWSAIVDHQTDALGPWLAQYVMKA
jgi:putative hydrolase of the HAD superfamily